MAWFKTIQEKLAEHEAAADLYYEKLNPSQAAIALDEGIAVDSKEQSTNYKTHYEAIEIVNRAINMIVDDVSAIPIKVSDRTSTNIKPISSGVKATKVHQLLNIKPNSFIDISTFRRNLFIDMMMDGNIFVYFDGAELYQLPAEQVTIVADDKTYIDKFEFRAAQLDYSPEEIIHVKDNSFDSKFRGIPRIKPALRTMKLIKSMRDFQDNFFKNGAITGIILMSDNTLSTRIKDRMLLAWAKAWNPVKGGKRPIILDGGLKIDKTSEPNFKDLDFQGATTANEEIVLKGIGVPPLLLAGGNNVNIRPNLRLYYLETVLPLLNKYLKAFERYFGFTLTPDLTGIPALQPELKEQAHFYSTLVNAGIITPNEAREGIGKEAHEDGDELRVPANIAGSAANPAEGGRPSEDDDE